MKRISLLAIILTLSIFANAQVTGIKNIPGDYASLAAAIADLNTVGVGTGGVTINLNQAQTAPSGGYLLGTIALNLSTSPSKRIIINGKNNIITAQALGTNTFSDAVFRIAGTDYVTLDSINIIENAANVTTTTQMEWGIAGLNLSSTDGSQNIIIQNSSINLNGTTVNPNEMGIFFSNQIVNSTAVYSTTTSGGSAAAIFDYITVRNNTINNCYNGIGCNNGSQAPIFFQNSVIIGGPESTNGNTITNYGNTSGTTTVGYGIYCNNGVGNPYISYNKLSATGISNICNHIYPYYYVGSATVSNNDVTFTTSATNTGLQYIIYQYTFVSSGVINSRCDSNYVHDITIGGTSQVYGIYHYVDKMTGTNKFTRKNLVKNITRTGVSGAFTGIYDFVGAATTVTNREMSNNVVSNIKSLSLTGTGLFVGLFFSTTHGGIVKGNKIDSLNVNNTFTTANSYNLFQISNNTGTSANLIVDSNQILNVNYTGPSVNLYGTNINNSSSANKLFYTRNLISSLNVVGGGTLGTLAGIFVSGNTGSSLSIINNQISKLSASAAIADNYIKGIDVVTGNVSNGFIYNNTINLGTGTTLSSSGTNFGASGISTLAPVNIKNNIIRVNAQANGTGYISAIRSLAIGTVNVVSANLGTNSSNNILYVPTNSKAFLYAECALNTAPLVSFNLINDPFFNTSCGNFKTLAGSRASSTFIEDDLIEISTNVFAPTGVSYAESNASIVTDVVQDFNGITRPIAPLIPDCGSLEFVGTLTDAAGPVISYNLIPTTTYCTTLPSLMATITDASGVNNGIGTKPRLYFKKSTENNAYVGNANTDNGWKFVEATNSSSPYIFNFDASKLTSPVLLNDIIQYFIVAQDSVATPNISSNLAGFATCATSVNLSSLLFPLNASPIVNQMKIVAPGGINFTAYATPTNVCNPGSTVLSVVDTTNGSQLAVTGYCIPNNTSSNAANFHINNFSISGATINVTNNNSGPATNTYADYYGTSSLVSTAVAGSNITMTASGKIGFSYGWTLYVDWNKDGIFNTSNERMVNSSGYVNAISSTFTIPFNALGIYRMRIVNNNSVSSNVPPCNTTSPTNGETEDYAINILAVNSYPTTAFSWSPSTNISTNPNRSVTANNITNNTVYTVTASDAGGCTYTATTSVQIANPVIITGLSGNTSYCSAVPNTTLTLNTSNGALPISSTWIGGPVVSINGLTAVLNPPVGTTIYTVTALDGCGSTSSTSVSITVNQTPNLTLSPGSVPVCSGVSSIQTATSNSLATTYSWMPGNLTGSTNLLSQTINTVYTITAIDGLCSSSKTILLSVVPNPTITSPTTNPSTTVCYGDSIQINSTITSGIDGFYIYPIPFSAVATPVSGVTVLGSIGSIMTPLTIGNLDEGSWNGLTLPFTFNYLGTNFNGFAVSTNGFIYLGGGTPPSYQSYGVSHPNINMRNTICAIHADLDFRTLGTINYFTIGTAPNRKFVVNFTGGQYFTPVGNLSTQIVLYETSNEIEFHTTSCTGNINATMGCDNLTGTSSYLVPGRNNSIWTVTNPEAYRFVPQKLTAAWSPNTFINNSSISSPKIAPLLTTTYTVTATNNFGCISTNTATANIGVPAVGNISVAPTSICAGNNAVLNGTMQTVCLGGNLTGFQGIYAPLNWTNNNDNSNGTVTTNLAPTSISLFSGTNGTGNPGYTNYSIIFPCSGNVSFNWQYTTQDFAFNDYPIFKKNSIILPNTFNLSGGSSPQNGLINLTVNAGDTLTIQAYTEDNDGLFCSLRILNFNAPKGPAGGNVSFWSAKNGGTNLGTNSVMVTANSTTTYYAQYSQIGGCTNPFRDSIVLNVIPLPNVVANATPSVLCLGDSVIFAGGGANTYTWSNSIVNNSKLKQNSAGSTIYTVTGVDANGCSNTSTVTVKVNSLPSITASANPSPTCVNASTIFSGGGANTYTWTDGINNPINNLQYFPTTSGIITYTVTGTDTNNCVSSTTYNLTVNSLPIVQATINPFQVCIGDSIILVGTGATTYTWTNGTSTPLNNVKFVPTTSTIYTVTGTDGNMCSATSSISLNLNPLPTISAAASATPICFGSTTILTGSGANTYTWTDGTNTPLDNVAYTPTLSGTTSYTVTGTDANTCTATSSVGVFVYTPTTFNNPVYLSSKCPGVIGGSVLVNANSGNPYTIAPIGPGQLSNGIFNNLIGGITYTVSSVDANMCTVSTTVSATNAANGGLSNATPLNILSVPGNFCQNQNQIDGSTLSYYGASCDNLIATVNDGNGGNTLGNVNACVTVLPTVPTFNTQPYLPRYYIITPLSQGPAVITLYLTQDDFDDYNAAAGSFPQIPAVQSVGTATFSISQVPQGFLPGASGATTIVHNVTATWNATANRWEVTFPVTSFSGFYFHASNPLNSALPAAIVDFKGRKTETTDLITWSTTSELNNAHFNVLYSNNGKDFATLGTINSKATNGNSNQVLSYRFENNKPTLGHNYYKLEQVDLDGKTIVNTNVVDLMWGSNGSTVSIYPNPTKDELNIDVYTTKAQNNTIKLLDMSGRVIKEIQSKLEAGANNIKMNLGDLATGIYTIQLVENNKIIQVSKVQKN